MSELNIPKIQIKKPEINMSSLVDVVFLLLIFFMVTTVFPENSGVIIEKPASEQPSAMNKESIKVKINAGGDLFFQDKPLDIDDLKRVLKTAVENNETQTVVIHADKETKTEILVAVIDAAKASGAKQLGLATDEKTPKS